MIATRNPMPTNGVPGINVVLLSDGSSVHIEDIETADQGQAILDDLDGAIDRIESQVDDIDAGRWRVPDGDWSRRAAKALKRKRRIRPRLQQRIGDLRRQERADNLGSGTEKATSPKDARRKAFVAAAEELLDREVFTEIWARAAEMKPAVFVETEASNA